MADHRRRAIEWLEEMGFVISESEPAAATEGASVRRSCAQYLRKAGASLQGGNPDALLLSISSLFRALPSQLQQRFSSDLARAEDDGARAA